MENIILSYSNCLKQEFSHFLDRPSKESKNRSNWITSPLPVIEINAKLKKNQRIFSEDYSINKEQEMNKQNIDAKLLNFNSEASIYNFENFVPSNLFNRSLKFPCLNTVTKTQTNIQSEVKLN